ncbi:MAG: hypothetical protein WAM91_01820 [Candidatus Acidiferrales bacterium]
MKTLRGSNLFHVASVILLCISVPRAAKSQAKQNDAYGFQDIHVGMSVPEFRLKHPAPVVEKVGPQASPPPGEADCFTELSPGVERKRAENPAKGIATCSYGSEPIPGIPLRIQALFIDGKLAVIVVETPGDDSACLEPPPSGPDLSFYLRKCGRYQLLWQSFIDKLGPPKTIVEGKPEPRYHALRWETETSVAEFQNHDCGPWTSDKGPQWGKIISEVLEGIYCGPNDTLNARQPVMLYLNKELSRALTMRLTIGSNPARR